MRLFVLIDALLIAACSSMPTADNPFGRNYVHATTAEASASSRSNDPSISRGGNREADERRLLAEGYQLIGTSTFEAGNIPPEKARVQARLVHADVVLVYSELAGKRQIATAQPASRTEHALRGKDGDPRNYGRLAPAEISYYRYFASFWAKLAP